MIKNIQYCLFKNKCRLVVKDKNGGLINISKTKIENVNRSIQKVKTNQMSAFGIEPSDSLIDSYINAVSVKKGDSKSKSHSKLIRFG